MTSDPLSAGGSAPAERRATAPHWPLLVGCAVLVLLGLVLRLEQLGSPRSFGFDEHHFVENARNYLRGRADLNDHPPLGKLTIALSMRAFGDESFAWRVPALVAGLATIALGAALARRLFPSRLAPWIAAAFLAGDGFFIGYSRAGLLDAQLVALAAGAALLVASRPGARALVAAGLLAGLAMNVKLSGVVLIVPIALGLAQSPLDRRARLAAATGAALAMAIGFCVPWAIGLGITGRPGDPWSALQETRRLVAHHAALTKMDNDLTSSW
ncbi:MAG: glycosyltransferase family 39 protein, partial [Polyangiaceae bacterium]|nr:glycosyltransferase family 39 protein [Polyangiaceae bacterium]